MDKICVILTGGTICSLPDENRKNQSNAAITSSRLTEHYLKESHSPYQKAVEFDIRTLRPDILSENMTVSIWGDILKIFREEIDYSAYKGIIVLHGTDTLAYTAAFLSFALAGIPLPVCMVSAQLRLGEERCGRWVAEKKTNGYANFRAATELILNGIAPNVYAVYRNEANENHDSGAFLVHYGAHLLQSPNASNNFHSRDEMLVENVMNAKLSGQKYESDVCLYKKIKEIKDSVLMLFPHTGLNYERVSLEGVCAVIHGTYHSESVCIGRPTDEVRASSEKRVHCLEEIRKEDRPYSILSLLSRCEQKNIPVIIAPCNISTAGYGTTFNACEKGAHPLAGITLEAAYAKAVLACALDLKGNEFLKFMEKSINFETSLKAENE